jgi:hypothetical protein
MDERVRAMGEPRSDGARRYRTLALVLRGLGGLDLLALAAVFLPRRWLEVAHAWAGLGELPDAPVVGYLIRSASALYALHGAMVLYLSFDVVRYWRLIRFLAVAALVHGVVMLGIDLAEGMPAWWRYAEGPCFAATGAVVLFLLWWSGDPEINS